MTMKLMDFEQQFNRRDFIKAAGLATATAAFSSATLVGKTADDEQKIIVALVGCAHIHTPSYAGYLASRDDVEVKYVWDHDASRAERYANQLKSKPVTDLNVIWKDPSVKGVVICSETNRHKELILAAAHAGKDIFAEKPLGVNAKEAFEMAKAMEDAKVKFTTGYFMRCDPKHIFLKDQVDKGNFGKITRIRGSNTHNGSLGGWFDGEYRWMADPKIAGVGAFGDMGTHSLDLMMWLIGDVSMVTADIKAVTHRYGDCDETGEALLNFKNEVIGTLAAAWVDIDNPVSLLISGTEAHAVIFKGELYYNCPKVPNAAGQAPWTDLPPGLPEPIAQFLDAVSGKDVTTLVTPHEAATRVSVMEAAYKGSKQRAWCRPATS